MTGRGATLMNFLAIGGTGLMQSVSGGVYDFAGGEANPQAAYDAVIWLYIASVAVALFIYAFAKDQKPR